MNTEILTKDYNVDEGYFKKLNPLNDGVICIRSKCLPICWFTKVNGINRKKMQFKIF